MQARFKDLDKDGSGSVDKDEYVCCSIIEALTHARTRLIDLLDRMDSNHNRKISAREFREALRRLGFDAEPKQMDTVFAALDEDSSGEIEYKELVTALRPGTIARNKHAIRRVSGGRKSRLGTVKICATSNLSVQEQLRKALDDNYVRVIDLFRDWDVECAHCREQNASRLPFC